MSIIPNGMVSEEKPTTALIIGDENFTFTSSFLESRHRRPNESIEVASCLPEDKLPNEFRPNYLAIKAQGVNVHFGINPAQLRNHFFNNQYDRIIFILPGIALTGFPEFLDKKADPLFRLRLHIYMFGFLKSSRNALNQTQSVIQFLWPRQGDRGEMPPWVPWYGVDLIKIGPFCEVFRSEGDDEAFDFAAFQDWHPLIHNVATESCPAYLQDSQFYAWRLTPPPAQLQSEIKIEEEKSQTEEKDNNLLFVPPELWSHSVEVIPHVNDLFKFEMKTDSGELMVVSKPTLKFDPRFRADGAPAKNPFTKRSNNTNAVTRNRRPRPNPEANNPRTNLPPPPPPPPDMSGEAMLGARPPLYDLMHPGYGRQPPGAYMGFYDPKAAELAALAMDPFHRAQLAGAFRRDPLLLQDELSLQYGDVLQPKRARFDPLEAALFQNEYDAYRQLELGMVDPGMSYGDVGTDLNGFLPEAPLEHQDVLMYERLEQQQHDPLAPRRPPPIMSTDHQLTTHDHQLLFNRRRLIDDHQVLLNDELIDDPLLIQESSFLDEAAADNRRLKTRMEGHHYPIPQQQQQQQPTKLDGQALPGRRRPPAQYYDQEFDMNDMRTRETKQQQQQQQQQLNTKKARPLRTDDSRRDNSAASVDDHQRGGNNNNNNNEYSDHRHHLEPLLSEKRSSSSMQRSGPTVAATTTGGGSRDSAGGIDPHLRSKSRPRGERGPPRGGWDKRRQASRSRSRGGGGHHPTSHSPLRPPPSSYDRSGRFGGPSSHRKICMGPPPTGARSRSREFQRRRSRSRVRSLSQRGGRRQLRNR